MFIVLYACKYKHFQLNEFLAKKSKNLYGRISNHRSQCHRVSMHYSHTGLRESLFMLTHCHPESWKFDSTSAKFVRSAIFVQMCPLLNRKFNIWDFRGCCNIATHVFLLVIIIFRFILSIFIVLLKFLFTIMQDENHLVWHHFPLVFTYYQLYLFLKFITEEDKSSK